MAAKRWLAECLPGVFLVLLAQALLTEVGSDNVDDWYQLPLGCFGLSKNRKKMDQVNCPNKAELAWFDSVQQMQLLAPVLETSKSPYLVGIEYDTGEGKFIWTHSEEAVEENMWSSPPISSMCGVLERSSRQLLNSSCEENYYFLCRRTDETCPDDAVVIEGATTTKLQTTPDVTTVATGTTTSPSPPDVTMIETTTTSQTAPDVTTIQTTTTSQTTPHVSTVETTTTTTSQTVPDVITTETTTSQTVPDVTTSSAQPTQPMSSSPQQPTTAPHSRMCSCNCIKSKSSAVSLSSSQVTEIVNHIKSELTVETGNLSATVRKKTSAPDKRPAAQISGVFAIVFLVLVGLTPVFLDTNRICVTVKGFWNRTGFARKSRNCKNPSRPESNIS